MDLVKLFLSDDPRGADIINLLLCMLGALWMIGIKREDRSEPDWQAWLGFWLGTAAYYVVAALAIVHVTDSSKCTTGWIICNVTLCHHPAAVPGFISRLGPPFEQVGLNVGTGFLLWAEQSRQPGTAPPWIKPTALVLGASILDFWLACNWGVDHAGIHQALTAFAFGLAAWRLRERDQAKSSTLLFYALIQLPVQPFMELLGIQTGGYSDFVASTLAVYAAAKIALIPVSCFIATRVTKAAVAQ